MYLLTKNAYVKPILAKADQSLIHSIREIAHNILYGTVTLSEDERKEMTTHKGMIKRLLSVKNPRLYLQRNHQKLLPLLLPLALRAIYGDEASDSE
jgi:hypothetical protein